jgi:hypothetical protein
MGASRLRAPSPAVVSRTRASVSASATRIAPHPTRPTTIEAQKWMWTAIATTVAAFVEEG